MINSSKWDKIVFKAPRIRRERTPISELLGYDTEALRTGAPFLCAFSDGKYCKPKQIFNFIRDNYQGADIAVYNLKYDSGATIFTIPKINKIELWKYNKTTVFNVFTDEEDIFRNLYLTYFPHKNLRVSWAIGINKKGNPVLQHCNFWDISQFYNMSLNEAAKRYLGKEKEELETKTFSLQYVKINFKKILSYCIKDAALCSELGNYFLKKLESANVTPSALYSSAFLSAEYFKKKIGFISSWRYYKYYPDMMRAALDSYQGGKFEITARGRVNAYIYDIVSAYPFEIANLVDISFAECISSKEYQPQAVYGYIRCYVNISESLHITSGIMLKNNRVCPIGCYFTTLTKREYEYYTSIGVEVQILEAFWLFVKAKKYPYREIVKELFLLKDKYKKIDIMQTNVYKVMLNGYYGKLAQILEQIEAPADIVSYHPGQVWNPMYASEITAGTRLQVTKYQNRFKNKCLAVHTDSILLTEPLADNELGTELGELKLEGSGDTVLIACGQYELIGKKGAYKGIWPENGETWRDILKKAGTKSIIEFPYTKVESWVEAVAKGHFNKINLFTRDIKKMNLNVDTKRLWPSPVRACDLLEKGFLQHSEPAIIINTKPPEFWNIKGRKKYYVSKAYKALPLPEIM